MPAWLIISIGTALTILPQLVLAGCGELEFRHDIYMHAVGHAQPSPTPAPTPLPR